MPIACNSVEKKTIELYITDEEWGERDAGDIKVFNASFCV